MEDRLHVHRIRAKQWPNDRQYFIQLGTHGLRNRTDIGVDRALPLTGSLDPGARVEDRTKSQDRDDSGYERKVPSSAAGLDNSFSRTPSFSTEYSFMTKYRKFLSFFTTLDRSNIFFFYLQILIIYIEIWQMWIQ